MPAPVTEHKLTQQQPDEAEQKPRKKPRRWYGVVLGLITGFAGLAITRIGQLWPNFDVLSNFTLHAVFWIAAFALASIVPRHKVLAAWVFLTLMVVGWSMRSHLDVPPPANVQQTNAHIVTIGHFNTFAKNTNFDAVQKQIENMQADAVSILEAKADKLPMIEKLKAQFPYVHGCVGQGKCEMAILSKYPFAETSKRGEFQQGFLPYVWVKFGPELGGLTLVAAHTQRFPNVSKQWQHISDLRALIEARSGNIIMTGDFNATPFSRTLQMAEEVTGLHRLTNKATWPAQFGLPQLAIDHILASRGITAASAERVGLAAGSDHLPISMTLRISAK